MTKYIKDWTEDQVTEDFLNNRDVPEELNQPCEVCNEAEAWITLDGKEICTGCYESAIDQAERMIGDS